MDRMPGTGMDWLRQAAATPASRGLLARLEEEGFVLDTGRRERLEALRRDVERVASDMDDPSRPPPMFWSGIPWPAPGPESSCDYHLVVSVGGTKTDFALLRLERGRLVGLDLASGREVGDPAEIDRAKQHAQMATPRYGVFPPRSPRGDGGGGGSAVRSAGGEARDGHEMIAAMVRHFARVAASHREALERCEAILLSWGFAQRVVRTGDRLAGGLSAVVTKMTKDQAGFTRDLAGKDVAVLLDRELRAQLGWSRPIAVANDTVMALHYFLQPRYREGRARVGLFINGTGTNFAAAEPHAVRREGIISRAGEEYTPERLTRRRPLRPGESEELFFVNYESGSIELVGTRTRFDTDSEYPIERNALAGGNAFPQKLRALVEELVGPPAYQALRSGWARVSPGDPAPGSLAVSALATAEGVPDFLRGLDLEPRLPELRVAARATCVRSALHAALVLAAVTVRTGFGKGEGGKPDLLGMEGSVWKIPGYPDLVRRFWVELAGGGPLAVDLEKEPTFNASLPGPLYLAAMHRGEGHRGEGPRGESYRAEGPRKGGEH